MFVLILILAQPSVFPYHWTIDSPQQTTSKRSTCHRLMKCLIPPEPSRTPVPQGSPVRLVDAFNAKSRSELAGVSPDVLVAVVSDTTKLSFVDSCFTGIILLIRLVLSNVNCLCYAIFPESRSTLAPVFTCKRVSSKRNDTGHAWPCVRAEMDWLYYVL